MDAETRVSAEDFFLQCKTGAHGSLCEGTEGSVVDPSRISPQQDLYHSRNIVNTRIIFKEHVGFAVKNL
jgi:hypothetical protein